jgi:hypothetical protein
VIYIVFNQLRYAEVEAGGRGINPRSPEVVMVRSGDAIRGRRLVAGDQIIDFTLSDSRSTTRQYEEHGQIWQHFRVMAAQSRLALDGTRADDGIWSYIANPTPEASKR